VLANTGGPAAPPPPKAKPGVLDSVESCKECHEEIWNEWKEDRHSKAWTGQLYTELSKNHTDANCWSCHAPRPVLETGLESPAETRANYREEGITCLTCHQMGEHVVGSRRDPAATPEVGADCGPMFSPKFAREDAQDVTIQYCGVCHNPHGTHLEFMASKYYRDGKSCLSCHMEETMGPVAKGGKPRLRRVHRFGGSHSLAALRKSMALEPRVEDGKVVVRVVNEGAGHKIPTDARHRAIWVRAAFFDAYDQPVAVPVPGTDNTHAVEVQLDEIRLYYRHEQRESTQVDPAGTPGKPNWRECSIEIPPEARGGRVRIRLYYAYWVFWPLEKAQLVEERVVSLAE
jgi:predicted CXXCH cytochrome family protein